MSATVHPEITTKDELKSCSEHVCSGKKSILVKQIAKFSKKLKTGKRNIISIFRDYSTVEVSTMISNNLYQFHGGFVPVAAYGSFY